MAVGIYLLTYAATMIWAMTMELTASGIFTATPSLHALG